MVRDGFLLNSSGVVNIVACPPLELIRVFVRVGIALVLPLLNNNSGLASTLVLNFNAVLYIS